MLQFLATLLHRSCLHLGRFDESVIEERRQASIKLLMFILLYPEMLEHKGFVNFIEVVSNLKNLNNNFERKLPNRQLH